MVVIAAEEVEVPLAEISAVAVQVAAVVPARTHVSCAVRATSIPMVFVLVATEPSYNDDPEVIIMT